VTDALAALAASILERAGGSARFLVGIAGPPGAGKSTQAEALLAALNDRAPGTSALVPMDGFHLDNAVLSARGLLARKGAPETFDVDGFAATLGRIRAADAPVAVPVFDRDLDLARAGARCIDLAARVVLVEGNYLLLDEPPWRALAEHFDLTLFLSVDEAELYRRLLARWRGYGLDPVAAEARADGNDMANARRILAARGRPDLIWHPDFTTRSTKG
jgi:pantothenate kinase